MDDDDIESTLGKWEKTLEIYGMLVNAIEKKRKSLMVSSLLWVRRVYTGYSIYNYISLPKSGKDVSEIFLGMEKAYVNPRLVRKGRIYSALGKWKRCIYFKD